jgi:hypothetical protein
MRRAPAIYTIGPYAAAIDRRIAAVTVVLEMHHIPARDDVEWWPRIVDAHDAAGASLNLGGSRLDGLAQRAWDVVESRTAIDMRSTAYRVTIAPAVAVYPISEAEL